MSLLSFFQNYGLQVKLTRIDDGEYKVEFRQNRKGVESVLNFQFMPPEKDLLNSPLRLNIPELQAIETLVIAGLVWRDFPTAETFAKATGAPLTVSELNDHYAALELASAFKALFGETAFFLLLAAYEADQNVTKMEIAA